MSSGKIISDSRILDLKREYDELKSRRDEYLSVAENIRLRLVKIEGILEEADRCPEGCICSCDEKASDECLCEDGQLCDCDTEG